MTEYIHVLIAADQEDAYDYVGDPQYTVVKYIGDMSVAALPIEEASFTPRATNMPHWMDTLRWVQGSMRGGDANWREKIHYISLYEDKEPS